MSGYPHGMNCSAFLIKHRLQPLVAGAAELRSVVLIYEMDVRNSFSLTFVISNSEV